MKKKRSKPTLGPVVHYVARKARLTVCGRRISSTLHTAHRWARTSCQKCLWQLHHPFVHPLTPLLSRREKALLQAAVRGPSRQRKLARWALRALIQKAAS